MTNFLIFLQNQHLINICYKLDLSFTIKGIIINKAVFYKILKVAVIHIFSQIEKKKEYISKTLNHGKN